MAARNGRVESKTQKKTTGDGAERMPPLSSLAAVTRGVYGGSDLSKLAPAQIVTSHGVPNRGLERRIGLDFRF